MKREILAAAVAGAAGVMAWGVRGRSSNLFAPSYWRGSPAQPRIALTFDDGPSESTPDLLRILDRHGIKATFFVCGMHVRRLPGVARAAVEAGHELANHSDTHPAFYFKSTAFMTREIREAQRAIQDAAGVEARLFRPPYGVRWPGLAQAQKASGVTGILWTVIGQDWRLAASAITERVCGQSSNGAIICLHDGRAQTVGPDISATLGAVNAIIPRLADRGFIFTTVSDLLWPKQVSRNE